MANRLEIVLRVPAKYINARKNPLGEKSNQNSFYKVKNIGILYL
jgi:hypothetical protein